MICPSCGRNNEESAKYCAGCGAPLDEYRIVFDEVAEETNVNQTVTNTINNEPTKYSGKAIAGFVLGLVGMVVSAVICGTLGIIFSALGMSDVKKNGKKGFGLAVAGLVVSIIDIVLWLLMLTVLE